MDLILLDFSKTFDRVPHSRLHSKLNYYGIRKKTQVWIQAFLSKRRLCVSVNRVLSKCARFVTNNHRHTTNVSGLLTNPGWQTIERCHLQSQMSMLYKINQNLVKITVPPNLIISSRITRNNDTTNLYKFSATPTYWPILSTNVQL